jgi:LuxR family maltose regulon positive regulatory protein
MSIPPLRPGAISRPRLVDQVNAGLIGRLTLVVAPAGFGKTTLILEWLKQLPVPGYPWEETHCAWVSLVNADNQPKQFFAYLLGALQRMTPGFGADLLASLDSSAGTDLLILIQDLLNDFATQATPFLLVLDDYHVITDDSIHKLINLLIEHLPTNVHLVITSRSMPPLDLPRWRARGYLHEITAPALRFTQEETQAFLAETMRLDLPDEVAVALEDTTEGWAAGLQLIALALRAQSLHEDWDQQVDWRRRFTGSERTVADYLLAEVLAHQPAEVQEFLFCTVLMPQFNAPLCNQLLSAADDYDAKSRLEKKPAQQMLKILEKSDLFLIPLDNQRQWYRYHHLFADLLQDRLRQAWSKEKINTLHLAASDWFGDQGMIHEAIDQAFKAGAEDAAAKLIEAIPKRLLWHPDLVGMIPSWSQQLSESTLASHPGVILNTAAVQLIRGQISELRKLLENLKQYAVFDAERMILEAVLLRNDGQMMEAFEMLQEANGRLPASSDTIQDIANLQLAVCSMQLGDLDEAERYTNTIRTKHETLYAETVDAFPVHLQAIQWHGYLVAMKGDLNLARTIFQSGLDRIAASGQASPMSGSLCAQLGSIHYQWNEIQRAQDNYDQAMAWGERTRISDVLFGALFGLAELACYYQETESLQDVLDQFNRFVQDAKIPGFETQMAWTAAGYWLRMGDLEKAVRWAKTPGLPLDIPPPYPLHEGYQALAAVRVAESRALKSSKHLRQMLMLVDQLIPQAKLTQNRMQLIRDFLLKSLILDGLSKSKEAVRTLHIALELGQEGGYTRVYLDAGPLLHDLLQKALHYGEHITVIRRLLIEFAKEPSHRSGQIPKEADAHTPLPRTDGLKQVDPLIEPLTDRENEVLQLIARGLSNKAIQEQLFISNNTVRTHIKNLYSKLGVNNRTQAVLRAQELRLA